MDIALGRKAPYHNSVDDTSKVVFPKQLKINGKPVGRSNNRVVSWGVEGWKRQSLLKDDRDEDDCMKYCEEEIIRLYGGSSGSIGMWYIET